MDKAEIKKNINILQKLTLRNIKIFFKDKGSVFFSFLGPLIILLLYVLFLGDLQVSGMYSFVPEGVSVSEKAIKAFVDSWMFAGVLGYACITISFNANVIMVMDRQKGVLNDAYIAPIKRWIITISYFIYNLAITLILITGVFIICLIYAAIRGWYFSFFDILSVIGTIILSVLSSTLLSVFFCKFIKTEAQQGAVVGIVSSIIGFFMGAYMPMSIMPDAAKYISCFIPGTYSTGLFRSFLMRGALENLTSDLPEAAVSAIREYFAMDIDLFGTMVGPGIMAGILAASVVLFFVLNIVFSLPKKNK